MAAKKTTKKTTKKKAASTKKAALPSPAALADMLGVTIEKRMTRDDVWRLRKAVPGYAAMLDDAAELLGAEGAALGLTGITPADLLAAQEEQKYLAAREAVLYAVYRSVYQQRLRVDDRAMKMLEKIARRVSALEEDDHTLVERWKLLLDFLATFRRGGAKKAGEVDETGALPDAEEAAPAGA